MHVLFVHQNFPAQFGHVAEQLIRRFGWQCTFVSQKASGRVGGIECIPYKLSGGATATTHYCSRTFENAIWHTHGVFEALRHRPDIRPDVIVGHSGFGSTLFLRELYDCPIVNYFEYFYRLTGADMDFRPDFPTTELSRLRARARNATILLDLNNCDAGYTPTQWQRSCLPAEYQPKVRVLHDGIDVAFWRPQRGLPRRIGETTFPDDMKLVTYAARGFESMRGFDKFMEMARQLAGMRSDVLFLIAGEDRICYGGDEDVIEGKSFREWVLRKGDYDLSRFVFLGRLPPVQLAQLLNLSDLHVYLTVPFVVSWSLLNAMACGALVCASDTAPVREFVRHNETGLLVDFFDTERMAHAVSDALDRPGDFVPIRQAAAALIQDRYSLDIILPQVHDLLVELAGRANSESARGG